MQTEYEPWILQQTQRFCLHRFQRPMIRRWVANEKPFAAIRGPMTPLGLGHFSSLTNPVAISTVNANSVLVLSIQAREWFQHDICDRCDAAEKSCCQTCRTPSKCQLNIWELNTWACDHITSHKCSMLRQVFVKQLSITDTNDLMYWTLSLTQLSLSTVHWTEWWWQAEVCSWWFPLVCFLWLWSAAVLGNQSLFHSNSQHYSINIILQGIFPECGQ